MLIFAIASLTTAIGYRFYNQPRLREGTIAPKTIWATRDATVTDKELTEERRKAAQTGLVKVLAIDETTTQQIRGDLNDFLARVEQMRQIAGALPFEDDRVLSLPTQRYLRNSSPEEWQGLADSLKKSFQISVFPLQPQETEEQNSTSIEEQNLTPDIGLTDENLAKESLSKIFLEAIAVSLPLDPQFLPNGTQSDNLAYQQALIELTAYGRQEGSQSLGILLDRVYFIRDGYARALKEFANPEGTRSLENYQRTLLDLRDETWERTREGIVTALDRILAQGIPEGLPEGLQKTAVRMQLRSQIPALTTPLATELIAGLLQPNLVEDTEQTKLLAEQAAEKVDPVVYEVRKGETIVKAGEEIDRRTFVVLDDFKESRRGIDWGGLIITGMMVAGSVAIFILVKRRMGIRLRCRDRILLCLLSVSTPLLIDIGQNNLAGIGLLTSSFYHPTLAITQVVLLTGLSAFSAVAGGSAAIFPWEILLAGTGGAFLTSIVAGRLRSREELALLSGGVGLIQGTVYLCITLISSATAAAIWSVVLPQAALFGVWGMAWCTVALGISPYLERVFDLVTPIRLAELSNPNRPLLKRLALETPGTFQHTLFVASLAEAAARELHCNVELVRAGTLYHDIGKMHDPLGFIENQMGGPNKHDAINDPWKSAEIIKKHVTEGLVMARKYNLPQAIRNFIPEHQGTILISYFYFQAKQRSQVEGFDLNDGDFRYDGPVPQSRETGIVMLADACEAALRSLKDATPEMALNTIKKIFRARWQDNQLAESGLKQEELRTIAEVFVRVWQQSNHQRIAYPKGALDIKATSRAGVKS
ncbi:MAG: HDIG domain-containing protein [Cyanobacteria bacterium SBLK]|nr:HDIG domain-containing protein [Cyanobacteria bacterium SBLK]